MEKLLAAQESGYFFLFGANNSIVIARTAVLLTKKGAECLFTSYASMTLNCNERFATVSKMNSSWKMGFII